MAPTTVGSGFAQLPGGAIASLQEDYRVWAQPNVSNECESNGVRAVAAGPVAGYPRSGQAGSACICSGPKMLSICDSPMNAKWRECAVAVETATHRGGAMKNVYKIRWFALPTWYPAGNDFSITCS
jgi:hypothetical protein